MFGNIWIYLDIFAGNAYFYNSKALQANQTLLKRKKHTAKLFLNYYFYSLFIIFPISIAYYHISNVLLI